MRWDSIEGLMPETSHYMPHAWTGDAQVTLLRDQLREVPDGKDDFTKSALFRLEWDQLYPGVIDWIPRARGGEVVRVQPEEGSGYCGAVNGRLAVISDGMSPIAGDAQLRRREAQQARDWYSSHTADSFGSAFKV